jgi:tRNA nucleotidyltransferase/poly(A) polymerase
MSLPKKLEIILESLRDQDWIQNLNSIGDTYIVGGCVRDAFRGEKIKDIDLIVDGTTMDMILEELIPFGRVDQVGESFAVIKFRPRGYIGEDFDIAVPRVDRKTGTGHKGFTVETDGVDLFDDLKRRDFTVNAIAVKVDNGRVVDPYSGQQDIKNRLLRAVDPNAFVEDPLRILRGIQFSARFGYSIVPQTLNLMKSNSHLIKEITGERIFDELMKILNKDGDTQLALDLIYKTDVDLALFDKKISHYNKGLAHLDTISFFYVLGLLGDVEPEVFLKKRLKGDSKLEKNVKVLNTIFKRLPEISDDEDLKYMLFRAFSVAPDVMEAVILPEEVSDIVLQMRTGKIPIDEDSISITGDDIKTIGGIQEGPEIGSIKRRIIRDALMNRFAWNNRKKSLDYLKTLFYLK